MTPPSFSGPILSLNNISRFFKIDDQKVTALDNIQLDIYPGEMIAIVGQSGSGKSTLLNVLGCLDQPDTGQYQVAGIDTSGLDHNQLAALRRDNFGFVFQRYHLLPHLTALDNILLPAIYSATDLTEKKNRALELMERLGIHDRADHKPSQLSGGQQQRVSIARALINGGSVVFADEPTGALDSHSGEEVMHILHELNRDGHTIVIVTHDHNVAAHTDRIIQLRDGKVLSDQANQRRQPVQSVQATEATEATDTTRTIQSTLPASAASLQPVAETNDRITRQKKRHVTSHALGGIRRWAESFQSAWSSISSHRLRSFLTMLGIIIGITSVVTIVALGEGAERAILTEIQDSSIKTISIYPGKDYEDTEAYKIRTLNKRDLHALHDVAAVQSATPILRYNNEVQRLSHKSPTQILGVSNSFFSVYNHKILSGTGITERHVLQQSQIVVIDEVARKIFFPGVADPIGQTLVLGRVPMVVVGISKPKSFPGDTTRPTPNLYIPYTTALQRFENRDYFSTVVVKLHPGLDTVQPARDIEALLTRRHGTKDFFLETTDTLAEVLKKTTRTLKLLISGIAFISLLVGGVGVMNIMLVSVSERFQEIGIRIAVGARRSDILIQFLIESVLLCLFGGIAGVLLSYGIGQLIGLLTASISLHYSAWVVLSACISAAFMGITFGMIPARTAARLNPVQALARE